jgi:DNA-binding PadR family transcriptional regulator
MSAVRRFDAVSDLQILAAIDRAERHGRRKGVSRWRMAEHLGVPDGAALTRRLRPQLDRLIEEGVLVRSRVRSSSWSLTEAGRKRLGRARRRRAQIVLPESPQHRRWRLSHDEALNHVEELRGQLREALLAALTLIDSDDEQARVWCELSVRLRRQCALLGWALYCIHEWDEPDDAHADRELFHRRAELDLIGTDLAGVFPVY